MTIKFSERIESIKPSATLSISNRAKELQQAGRDIIALSAGEPDFPTPETARKAGIKAIEDNFSYYTLTSGILPLREAICERLQQDFQLAYKPDEVIVGSGAKGILYDLFQVLLNPGDEVVIPSPYWVSYPDQVLLAGGKPVILETHEQQGFVPQADQLEKLLNKRSKILVLNFPSNPTGAIMNRKDLQAIAKVVKAHPDLLVISDEIYAHLVYDGFRQESIVAAAPEIKDQVIVVNGMSKSYAMTGWRIGYAAAPVSIIKALIKMQGQSISNACSIAQKAALGALRGEQDFIGTMCKSFDERRLRMLSLLLEIPQVTCFKPLGAFYCFPNFSAYFGTKNPAGKILQNSIDLATFFLEEMGVAVVPGGPFGAPEYLRLSFATSLAQIEKGLDRMRQGISKIK